MVKLKNVITNSYDYICALLLITLPFSNSIPNLLLVCLVLFYLVDFKFNYEDHYPKPFLLLTGLILYLFVQALFNGTFMLDFVFYKKYLYLIFIPILFYKTNRLDLLKNAALLTINATVIVSCYKIMVFHANFGYFPFADGWATNYVLVLERPYAGIFSVIAVIISFDLFLKSDKLKKYFYGFSFVLSAAFIAFISIRISILTLFALFLVYVFFYSNLSLRRKLLLLGSMGIAIVALFAVNKNISKRFFIQKSFEKTI